MVEHYKLIHSKFDLLYYPICAFVWATFHITHPIFMTWIPKLLYFLIFINLFWAIYKRLKSSKEREDKLESQIEIFSSVAKLILVASGAET